MPVNSFADYPLSWKPRKEYLKYPYYIALAEQLQNDILNGCLTAHTMLPPQRELADYLDFSLSTITKAYKLCEEKGLLFGKVGKGTFVADIQVQNTVMPSSSPESHKIEMGMTLPFHEHTIRVAETAKAILSGNQAHTLFDYSNPFENQQHIMIAQQFLSKDMPNCDANHIAFASGGQNALAISLASLFKPGDRIATDCFTYPNFIGLAKLFGLQLISIAGDSQGMRPDLLEQSCKQMNIRGIFLMPNHSNPTNICMSLSRKTELSVLINQYALHLLEDDTYAFMNEQKEVPLSHLVPEHFVYMKSISKAVCGGLRVAYMLFSPQFHDSIRNAIYNINLKTPSLTIEIASELLRTKCYDDLVSQTLRFAKERTLVFQSYFPELAISPSLFQWLPLPSDCSGKIFELMCHDLGVTVYGSERFLVNNLSREHAVRISTSSPENIETLHKGLSIVREVYDKVNKDHPSYII